MRSPNFNYDFDLVYGTMNTWGKTFDEDPDFCEAGPLIADIEIVQGCSGVNGKPCKYCYKSNDRTNWKFMDLDKFKTIIERLNFSNQLTQVAFGLASVGDENPALPYMCDYLRSIDVIPNGTVACPTKEVAETIAAKFGGCAVSYHGDIDVLADSVALLHEARKKKGSTLKQINIHAVYYEENYNEIVELLETVKEDERFEGLNAVVLLALKKCGRAESGPFTPMSTEKFRSLVKLAFELGVGLGFDSCSAPKFIDAASELMKDKIIETPKRTKEHVEEFAEMVKLSEPCESSLMSAYVNVDGEYFPCSFGEHLDFGFDVLGDESFEELWVSKEGAFADWRKRLIEGGRACPMYKV